MTDIPHQHQHVTDVAVIVDRERDNVAVARTFISRGTQLIASAGMLIVARDVQPGHRFALAAVPAGDWLRQYGQPFARSRGIAAGDCIDQGNTSSEVPAVDPAAIELRTPKLAPWTGRTPSFMGYVRADGHVGVRNWVLVVPVSMCASHEAASIAMQAELRGVWSNEKYANVDGVAAIPHNRGCGCPDISAPSATPQSTMRATFLMLRRYIEHPNVGAVLLVELGCEKTNLSALSRFLADAGHSCDDLSAAFSKPVERLTIQTSGGTAGTIRKGLEMLPALLAQANTARRQVAPMSSLAVGLKCGGSDAFSGITANPALGHASDLAIRAGASTLITEIPEFFGAEHLFAQRASSQEVAGQILKAMERFRAYLGHVGGSMAENPSPGNKAGGLLNITIKSLGAIAKSGTAPVEGVLEYGDSIWEHPRRGLHLLYCPSYDQESTPALVASGCQIVCFTTGRGTGIGNAIAPVMKIGSNSDLAQRMEGDIDINAGEMLDHQATVEQMGRRIFDEILAVASGKRVKAENNGHREFAIWSEEGVSL